MRRFRIHVQPHSRGGWQVRRDGASRASSLHDSRTEAIERGRSTARREHLELVVHGRDGRIRNPNSFGNDPRSRRDNVR
jgi:uncharacterized protein DUF2188